MREELQQDLVHQPSVGHYVALSIVWCFNSLGKLNKLLGIKLCLKEEIVPTACGRTADERIKVSGEKKLPIKSFSIILVGDRLSSVCSVSWCEIFG